MHLRADRIAKGQRGAPRGREHDGARPLFWRNGGVQQLRRHFGKVSSGVITEKTRGGHGHNYRTPLALRNANQPLGKFHLQAAADLFTIVRAHAVAHGE